MPTADNNLRESLHYTNALRIIESEGTGKVFEVVLIEKGFSKNLHPVNGLPIEYGEELLSNEATLKKFEGVSLYAYEFKGDKDMLFEHLPDAARAKAEGGVILNKVGFAEGVRYGEFQKPDGSIGHGIIAKARFVNDKIREMLRNAWDMGKKDIVGFSIDAIARMGEVISEAGTRFNRVMEFVELPEVTIVDEPGAGGILVRMLASANNKTKLTESKMNEKLLALLRQFAPHLVESITDDLAEDVCSAKLTEILDGDPVKKFLAGLAEQKAKDGGEKAPEDVKETPAPSPVPPALTVEQINDMIAKASARAVENALSNRNNAASKLAASRESLQNKLKESNLPKAMQDEITLEHYDSVLSDEQINKLIARRQNTIAALKESGLFVPGQEAGVTISKDQEDKWSDGLVAMLMGRPENGTPGFYSLHESFRVITGLNGSAEYIGERLYNDIAHCVTPRPQLITQSAWRGQLRESRLATIGRIKEASLATTTWAEVFGDSVRRAMIKFYQEADWSTWRMIVSEISSASDYRTMRRVRIGGLADLADVAELGTYQEISIPGDEEETFAVGKKGNLFSYSEEAAKNDDLGALRRIPLQIGRSAARTLYKSVFDVLRSNPVMGDGTVLFHANHGNLGSAAFDAVTLFAAITAMRDQTELSSSEVLGNAAPKYIVYPNELEKTVWEQARASVSSSASSRGETVNNFFLSFNLTPVPPVGYWTDNNNWYLIGDPAVCPTIEVAFLNGRQEPEILIQDQAQLGSVFTADKITFKGRLIYGVKALDHRFMFGAVVA